MFFYPVDTDLRLRLLRHGDAAQLYSLTDLNRAHLRQWLPWLNAVKGQDDSLAFIELTLRQHADGRGFVAGIERGGDLIGLVGHHPIDWKNRSVGLGYWIAQEWQGRGIMTRCCKAVIAHTFGVIGVHRVTICCAIGNARSRAIPERLGFRLEGTLREAEWLYDRFIDVALYACTTSEWAETMA
ncbi:MAG TPA: GNAT family protein [Aromatoleum sp.]|uniref:GNAT family N-acetyltransferase n=1 Tax=Aromatoleum sp. TaxID=2307007 RepID=UPI002B46DD51|nr:GNAT family protein [Aromatoleum sp.]HJV25809.1 GNAT family protein [Aromatoleum sp.]